MYKRRLSDYEKNVFTNNIINLTDEDIHLYDDFTGDINTFSPSDSELPLKPIKQKPIIKDNKLSYPFYVVEWERYLILKNLHRRLDDIAVISGKSCGRHDVMIARLFWARKPKCRIRFVKNLKLY